MIAIAWSRSSWYLSSERLCCGATVTESPVCTPIGSMFSIDAMITTLSFLSRMTSSSNSPQPSSDCSTSVSPIGLAASAAPSIVLQLVARVRDAAAEAAHRVARADDRGDADSLDHAVDLVVGDAAVAVGVVDDHGSGATQADRVHDFAEELALLGLAHRLVVGADHLDAEALERSRPR